MGKLTREITFIGVVVAAFVVAVYLFNVGRDQELTLSQRAQARAQGLIKNLATQNFMKKVFTEEPAPQGRGLASAKSESNVTEMEVQSLQGEIGRDPWGRPFYYKVAGDGARGSEVTVWSYGPNAIAESTPENLLAKQSSGDDLVFTFLVE